MFIDKAEIIVISGKGGDGVIHFRREKFIPRGGPDGGDGGRGGNVVLMVSPHLNALSNFQYKKKFKANDGRRGGKGNMTGRSAEDLIISVPPGTIVYDADTGDIIGDLVEKDQRLTVATGGRGGRGNAHFTSAINRAPRIAEKGEPGEERRIKLELKLIADVGVIGVPNAGKSTFLTAVTNAKPKIADYPFTTLEPNLGVARIDINKSVILADIPGLIEGAHDGIGLGFEFLRHIQRTRVLIHILDGLSEDPLLDFWQINSELALFDPELIKKPQIIVLNKIDLPEVREVYEDFGKNLIDEIKKKGPEINIDPRLYKISAIARMNTNKVVKRAAQLLQELPQEEEIEVMPVYRSEEDPNAYEIVRKPDGWRIIGKSIERSADMTYWEYYQSVRRFQKILEVLGIDKELREIGVQPGDTIYIGDHELEWEQ